MIHLLEWCVIHEAQAVLLGVATLGLSDSMWAPQVIWRGSLALRPRLALHPTKFCKAVVLSLYLGAMLGCMVGDPA